MVEALGTHAAQEALTDEARLHQPNRRHNRHPHVLARHHSQRQSTAGVLEARLRSGEAAEAECEKRRGEHQQAELAEGWSRTRWLRAIFIGADIADGGRVPVAVEGPSEAGLIGEQQRGHLVATAARVAGIDGRAAGEQGVDRIYR